MDRLDKKFLKQLVEISFRANEFNQPVVEKISSHLSRNELKKYVDELKKEDRKRTVIVEVPTKDGELHLDQIQSLFPNKKILFRKDTSLILGMRIIDDDIVYEFDLKDSLENMRSYIEDKL